MPIYEYQCRSCCACFEELVTSSNTPAPKCPECGCADVAIVYPVAPYEAEMDADAARNTASHRGSDGATLMQRL